MDRTGCAEGSATDRVMLYGSDWRPGSCDVSFAFYVAFFSSITFLRTLVAFLQLAIWLQRERRVRNTTLSSAGNTSKRKKRPVFPLLSLSSCSALLLFTILTSLNVANGSNGVPAFLLGLLYLPLAIQALILMTRVSRFGKKLLPRSTAKDPRIASDLSMPTKILRGIQVLHLGISIMVVTSFFAGLFDPVYATFQVGSAGYAVQDVIIALGLAYQYQRVIDAITSAQSSANTSSREDQQQQNSNVAAAHIKLKHVVTRLRLHQFVWLVMGPLVAAIWLVNVTRLTVPHYWMVMIFFSVELTLTAMLTFINIPKEWLLKLTCAQPKTLQSMRSGVLQTDALTPPVGTEVNGA